MPIKPLIMQALFETALQTVHTAGYVSALRSWNNNESIDDIL